jgi:hypothetical protein
MELPTTEIGKTGESNHLPGLFDFPGSCPIRKSLPQSLPLVMTSHYIGLYSLVDERKQPPDGEMKPYEDSTRGIA